MLAFWPNCDKICGRSRGQSNPAARGAVEMGSPPYDVMAASPREARISLYGGLPFFVVTALYLT